MSSKFIRPDNYRVIENIFVLSLVQIDDKSIDNVRVRIYRPLVPHPQKEILRPAIVYFHGGAFYMGSIGSFHFDLLVF